MHIYSFVVYPLTYICHCKTCCSLSFTCMLYIAIGSYVLITLLKSCILSYRNLFTEVQGNRTLLITGSSIVPIVSVLMLKKNIRYIHYSKSRLEDHSDWSAYGDSCWLFYQQLRVSLAPLCI